MSTEQSNSPNPNEVILAEATFNPAVTSYWLVQGCFGLLASVVGIVVIPFWFLFGQIITRRYLSSHHCVLTERSLKFKKGIFVKIEKTVPLDKITDVSFSQGPIMRMFGVEALGIETAGQSGVGALLQMQGIDNAKQFRDAVLAERDRVTASGQGPVTAPAAPMLGEPGVLEEIRDSLLRIEQLLKKDGP